MKRQLTFLKMSLVGLFSIICVGASAQVSPGVGVTYFCDGQSVTLQSAEVFDHYAWYMENDGSTTPPAAPDATDSRTYTASQTGNYYVVGWNDGECMSELSTAFPVYELPALAASITTVDDTYSYCTENSSTGITLTANYTPAVTAGLDVTYQWYMSEDASGANPVAITDATSDTYHVTEAEIGTHFYSVAVTYDVAIVGATSCNAFTTREVIVITPPAAPTITIVP